jgi:hypothetical protein
MIRVEVPGSSFMLCLGPGPPLLLHLTRANAEKPYAGDTHTNKCSMGNFNKSDSLIIHTDKVKILITSHHNMSSKKNLDTIDIDFKNQTTTGKN